MWLAMGQASLLLTVVGGVFYGWYHLVNETKPSFFTYVSGHGRHAYRGEDEQVPLGVSENFVQLLKKINAEFKEGKYASASEEASAPVQACRAAQSVTMGTTFSYEGRVVAISATGGSDGPEYYSALAHGARQQFHARDYYPQLAANADRDWDAFTERLVGSLVDH